MLHRVDRIILRVPALPSAIRYYREILGLKLLREEKQAASFLMADGLTEIILRDDPDQPTEEIYYLVDDVRDLYARRKELQLKFVQPPRQASRGYRAVVNDPFGNVLLLLDRTTQSAGETSIENAAAPQTLFAGVEPKLAPKREILSKLYEEVARTADDLPYTPQFEKLFALYCGHHPGEKPTRQETWRHLLNLRKAGNLPKLGEARTESPEISAAAAQILRNLLGADIGKRDRLPYSDRFDKLVDEFNKSQGRPISPHLVWRLVAKLAK